MQKVSFIVDGKTLTGNLFYPEEVKEKNPAILFIHGWKSSQARAIERAKPLVKLGFICMTFDLCGHGESEGDRNELSNQNYLDAVVTAYDFLGKQKNVDKSRIHVVGSSFGGYLATLLTSKRDVASLVLQAPASYPDEGFEEPKPDQPAWMVPWRRKKLTPDDNKAFSALHKYTNNILLVQSETDEWIPEETIENYRAAVSDKAKLQHTLLKDSNHSLRMGDSNDRYVQLLLDWFADKV